MCGVYMKKLFSSVILAACLSLLGHSSCQASNDDMLKTYLDAESKAIDSDDAYEDLELEYKNNPSDPVALFFFGSTGTLVGRDSWWPWNKLRYTENGLARIEKSLIMLGDKSLPNVFGYIPMDIYMKASAAVTYTQVPRFFGYFDKGSELFDKLQNDARFQAIPLPAKTWVHYYATQAALDDENQEKAVLWAKPVQESGLTDDYTQKTVKLMQ